MVKTLTDRPAQPTKKKTFRWSKLLLIALVLFCIFRLGDKVNHYYNLCDEAEVYRAQLAEAQAIYDSKQEEVQLLDNPAYLERLARERLGMVKDGETIVTPVETELASTSQ